MARRLNDEAETPRVGDDETLRKLDVRVLSQLGCMMPKAKGPVKAMRLAAAPARHALLTDFSMREPIVWN